MSAQKQLSDVSQGDYAMLSQSSQDQTQAMEEGTPPEKGLSTGTCPDPAAWLQSSQQIMALLRGAAHPLCTTATGMRYIHCQVLCLCCVPSVSRQVSGYILVYC